MIKTAKHIAVKYCMFYIAALSIAVFSCSYPAQEKEQKHKKRNIDPLLQLEQKDSAQLTHIKNQFYKNSEGHLYGRTFADREIVGIDTLVSVEYFNGQIPQDIDPVAFQALEGWFAKDKNFAYYYRPTSGGMLISKLESADAKSFKVLAGHYLYAVDDKHVFEETEILKDFNPATLKIIKDSAGKIIELISGATSYATK